ncbi:hypothetical protein O181_025222 [Austropuccinia psidii MF-1]|uniref:Uncharacterized protein n=1 Tax=Austropuccinia psidii MF-1 TaxID=1389203 RepID=A0A9Q3CN35_9BASI|nr:hypothetical protein [Austropuccinia psidii MF-1]
MVDLPYFQSFEWDFLVIDATKEEALILVFDFINHFDPTIDLRQGLVTFNTDYEDSSYAFIPLSNKCSSSNAFAALVGDFRAPSFPSFVHIPSLSSPPSLLFSKN